ncbi:MAG: helix-turn-helix transcriptional regulator [Deltaproteobacteria bacterium]|nr:helix-turn-helix transcriptional regulator [Deltaproteobacteria bacterium]
MKKKRRFLSLDEFGNAIGLSALDKAVVRQKNRMIDCLKVARLRKGLSQGELARRLGTKQPAIARMEAGCVGEVSFDFLIRVALALGVPLEVVSTRKAA